LNGWWRVGFLADVFIISTVADKGQKWPQFAVDTSGTMHAHSYFATAGAEWSLDGPHTVSIDVIPTSRAIQSTLVPRFSLAIGSSPQRTRIILSSCP